MSKRKAGSLEDELGKQSRTDDQLVIRRPDDKLVVHKDNAVSRRPFPTELPKKTRQDKTRQTGQINMKGRGWDGCGCEEERRRNVYS